MQKDQVLVWDKFIRVFHWSLVALFATAYLSGEEEGALHTYAGYGVGGLLLARLVWGFIGTEHARFSDFLYSPRKVVGYFRDLFAGRTRHYGGHNPAGGLMVIVLLLALLATTVTGLQAYGIEGRGPLADDSAAMMFLRDIAGKSVPAVASAKDREEDEEYWEELHEDCANFTLLLIGIHVLGVIVSSRLHRENLVKAMLVGYKAKT